jgi:hypothetical protein
MSRKKPCIKNRVPANIEDSVVNIAVEFPAYGQEHTANELSKERYHYIWRWCKTCLVTA